VLPSLYALPFYDFDLRTSHARTLLPAALASVPFGFVLVRVRVQSEFGLWYYATLIRNNLALLPPDNHLQNSKHRSNLLRWFCDVRYCVMQINKQHRIVLLSSASPETGHATELGAAELAFITSFKTDHCTSTRNTSQKETALAIAIHCERSPSMSERTRLNTRKRRGRQVACSCSCSRITSAQCVRSPTVNSNRSADGGVVRCCSRATGELMPAAVKHFNRVRWQWWW